MGVNLLSDTIPLICSLAEAVRAQTIILPTVSFWSSDTSKAFGAVCFWRSHCTISFMAFVFLADSLTSPEQQGHLKSSSIRYLSQVLHHLYPFEYLRPIVGAVIEVQAFLHSLPIRYTSSPALGLLLSLMQIF